MWAMIPIGVALIVSGILEVNWWTSPGTARLLDIFSMVEAQYGMERPPMLRGLFGAQELIAFGVVSLAYAALTVFVRRGSSRARTWAVGIGAVLVLVGLVEIAVDFPGPVDIDSYLRAFADAGPVTTASAADAAALVWPRWYTWLEDVAQAAQVIAFLMALLALATATVWHSEFFVNRKAEAHVNDAWAAALKRIRERAAQTPGP
jgi:hypothetical protein